MRCRLFPQPTPTTHHPPRRFGPPLGDIENVRRWGSISINGNPPERIPDPVVDAKLKNFPSLKMTPSTVARNRRPASSEGCAAGRRCSSLDGRPGGAGKPGSSPLPPVASEPPGTCKRGRPGDLEVNPRGLFDRLASGGSEDITLDEPLQRRSKTTSWHRILKKTRSPHAFAFEDLLMSVAKNRKMLITWTTGRALHPPKSCSRLRRSRPRALAQTLPSSSGCLPEKNKGLNGTTARVDGARALGVDGFTKADVIEVAKFSPVDDFAKAFRTDTKKTASSCSIRSCTSTAIRSSSGKRSNRAAWRRGSSC